MRPILCMGATEIFGRVGKPILPPSPHPIRTKKDPHIEKKLQKVPPDGEKGPPYSEKKCSQRSNRLFLLPPPCGAHDSMGKIKRSKMFFLLPVAKVVF